MKLRFGWGPVDGARGMQRNAELVKTVRDAVGDGIDVMADAYMGWTLDYAKRMIPLLEPFHLRWLEEPVIPDDIHGYAELKSYGRIPIAGGEHEFTIYDFVICWKRALWITSVRYNRVGIASTRSLPSRAIPSHVPHADQMQLPRSHGEFELSMAGIFPSSTWKWAMNCSGTSSRARQSEEWLIDLDDNSLGLD